MSEKGLRTLYWIMGYFWGGFFCTLVVAVGRQHDLAALKIGAVMVFVGATMLVAFAPWRDPEGE
jgi:hypothetical protein